MSDAFNFSAAQRALLDQLLAEADLSDRTLAAIPRRPAEATIPLSFAQERFWFLNQLGEDNAAYNTTPAWRLTGALDVAALQTALTDLCRRHAVLRTTYHTENGTPVQRIHPDPILTFTRRDASGSVTGARDMALQIANQPFDLAAGPLIRCAVIRITDADHVLVLAIHHIACDAWSMGVLVRELGALYTAAVRGDTLSLPETPIAYADYAYWQRRQAAAGALDTERTYWLDQLAGAPTQLVLPTDRPRPSALSMSGGTVRAAIGADTLRLLQQVSRDRGATLFTTLLSAFAVLLSRYSAETDILIGTPIANREHPEVADVVGLFLNTLVMRCRTDGNPSAADMVTRTHATVLDAFAHQAYPFEQLVDALQPARDLSRNPLFQVMLVLRQAPAMLDLAGLQATQFPLHGGYSKFDLTLFAHVKDDQLALTLEYNTDLFEASTAEQLLAHFGRLLYAIAREPHRPIQAYPLLAPAERHRMLVEWNNTAAPYPRDACVHDLVTAQTRQTPEACALLAEGHAWSYRAVEAQANRLTHHLRSAGAGRNVPVGVALTRSPQQIIAVLAVLKAGGAVVPLDPDYPTARLQTVLQECRPPLLLVEHATADRFPEFEGHTINLDSVQLSDQKDAPHHDASAESIAYILYTSGSTGRPKGVAMPHRALCNLVTWQQTQSHLPVGARTLQLTSLSFDVAFQEIFATLCTGGTLVLTTDAVRREPSALLRSVVEQRINRLFLPFVALHHLAEASDRLPSLMPAVLQEVITAGEQLRITPAISRFFERLPTCTLTNQYGPTETHVATAHTLAGPPAMWPQLPPIGRPIANAAVCVLDAHGQPVPPGVTGELYIGGDLLARGYWHRPNLTSERFLEDQPVPGVHTRLYRTGDLARYDAVGLLHFVGRADDQVKIRGYRVEPGEVEVMLMRYDTIESAVVAVEQAEAEQKRLLAYVVPKQGATINSHDVRNWLHAQLPDFMVPAAIVTLDDLPLTATGKINRRQLPSPKRESVTTRHYLAPKDGLETHLARIWESVLQIHPVGRDDDFFDLGGHSLLAIRLFAEIESRLGVRAPLASLFRAPTVSRLAGVLREQTDSADWSILVPIQPHGPRPPFFCVHGIGGGVLGYAPLAQHLGSDQPFYGLQAVGLDGKQQPDKTVEAMATRYVDVLRAVQPAGPYYLGGYCFGGLVAFEMARLLLAAGESIAHLALFEGYAPLKPGGRAVWRRPREWLNFARNLPYWVGDYVDQGGAAFVSAARRKQRLAMRRIKRRFGRNSPPSTVDVLGEQMNTIPQHARMMFDTQFQAQIRYKPQPHASAVTLYRVRRLSLLRGGDPLMGWGRLAQGGVDVRLVAGSHRNLLEPPYVQSLAVQLRQGLDQASADI